MSKSLIPKLEAIKQRYNEVADLIIQPDVITDQKRYSTLNKEYSDLGKIVKVFDEYKKNKEDQLYQAVMEIIVKANENRLKEGKRDMCNALLELMKDELDENKFYIMENGFILGVQMNLGSISK